MSRVLPWLLGLLLATAPTIGRCSESAPPETPKAPRLLLANGDFAVGRLVDSDQPNQIRWQCDALTTELAFPLAAISTAYFPPPQEPERGGDFSFELVGGDAITGTLAAVSDVHIDMHSKLLGDIRINRDQLRRIVRLDHRGETFFSGPNGLAGWSSPKPNHPWKDEGGQLAATAPASSRMPNANCRKK